MRLCASRPRPQKPVRSLGGSLLFPPPLLLLMNPRFPLPPPDVDIALMAGPAMAAAVDRLHGALDVVQQFEKALRRQTQAVVRWC
jgi:hypothetical protein